MKPKSFSQIILGLAGSIRFVVNEEEWGGLVNGCICFSDHMVGKSSLIAAMANYLKFDVCDLDLKDE